MEGATEGDPWVNSFPEFILDQGKEVAFGKKLWKMKQNSKALPSWEMETANIFLNYIIP